MSTESFLYAIGVDNAWQVAKEITRMARSQSRANETDCSYQRSELGQKMADSREANRRLRMLVILGPWLYGKDIRFHLNGDPRGYAFKLEFTGKGYARDAYPELSHLSQDCGGYFCFEEK